MIDQRTAPYAALLLRLVLGALFILHLYRKFYITGIESWWTNLEQNGYPEFVMIYTLSAEFAGAILLPLGVFTRWISLYALPMMIGASQYWLVRKGFWFSDAGAELPILWSLGLVIQALLGNGRYALKLRR